MYTHTGICSINQLREMVMICLDDSRSRRFFQLPPRARRQRCSRGAGAGGARGGTCLTSPSEELLASSEDPRSLDKDRRLPNGAPLTVAKFSSLKVSRGIPSGSSRLLLTENVLLNPLAKPSIVLLLGFGTSSELMTVMSSKFCAS